MKLTIHSNNEFIRLQSLRTLRIEYSQRTSANDKEADGRTQALPPTDMSDDEASS
jgi:hypothetical protein